MRQARTMHVHYMFFMTAMESGTVIGGRPSGSRRGKHYAQCPIDGPLSYLSLCTHFEHGGSPWMWLAQWLRDKRLESLQTAGSCDQLNLGVGGEREREGERGGEEVAAHEIVARRVQFFTEADANFAETQLGHVEILLWNFRSWRRREPRTQAVLAQEGKGRCRLAGPDVS